MPSWRRRRGSFWRVSTVLAMLFRIVGWSCAAVIAIGVVILSLDRLGIELAANAVVAVVSLMWFGAAERSGLETCDS